MSYLAYSILLQQLIATLIHYPYTVALPALANWSAFLEWGFSAYIKSQLRQWGSWKPLYGRYVSDIHRCINEKSRRPCTVGLFGPMTS